MKNDSCKAIIIDDEAWIREGLSEHVGWQELGIELVQAFQDGAEAYDYLVREPAAIVLTDIRMPNMTGLELLAKLHELKNVRPDRSIPKVIFLSGYEDFKYAQEAVRLGAVDYLLKPAEVEEIESSLAKAKRMCDESIESVSQNGQSATKLAVVEEPSSYLIKKAIHILATRFREDLHLTDIAGELFITPNYLSRLFRQETGKSFGELLSEVRLDNARALLLSNDAMKIYEVGSAIGYSNPRYFSEWFHKNTGMSPGEYRNHHYRS
ncbi:response regulator transcription factor [Cohnella lupini]|uniref:Helix-turn-helix protein n=1 Tax=Cohnella lupini TaxID=1294267 RepID=A0A3D9ICI4_9BACL|nr:helix-turn-helix domain-containing protein [Cohnella lupini]RED59387.1 helix-turn-helix protein [Cohnella lupini]